jgi:hypothetical protein
MTDERARLRCVIHIGAPKCGSSALQYALSLDPEPAAAFLDLTGFAGLPPAYCVLRGGRLISGSALAASAALSWDGCLTTATPEELTLLTESEVRRIRVALHELHGRGRVPIFSSEGLLRRSRLFADSAVLSRLSLDATVVAYLRPPLDYVNSAWWQWGVWSGLSFHDFVDRQIVTSRWAESLHRWRSIPGVEHVEPRLLPRDIVGDLLTVADGGSRNYALPAPVLRSMTAVSHLRPEHEPELDEAIRRWAGRLEGSAPWVIDEASARLILRETRAASTDLMDLLRPEEAQAMAADPRWWDIPERDAEPPAREPNVAELLPTIEILAHALRNADQQVRRLTYDATRATEQTRSPRSGS